MGSLPDLKSSRPVTTTLANPLAEMDIPLTLEEGFHTLCFRRVVSLEELLMAVPYAGRTLPMLSLNVNPQSGEVQVMPQKWFIPNKFDPSYQWITRIVRDPENGKIIRGRYPGSAFLN